PRRDADRAARRVHPVRARWTDVRGDRRPLRRAARDGLLAAASRARGVQARDEPARGPRSVRQPVCVTHTRREGRGTVKEPRRRPCAGDDENGDLSSLERSLLLAGRARREPDDARERVWGAIAASVAGAGATAATATVASKTAAAGATAKGAGAA